jgi:kinetochore protein Nuf2
VKTEEIVKCLNELGIPVRQEELQDPETHKESCRHILECLAEICTGISKEEMNQPSFAGLNAVIHPELHEESIPKFNHFRACCKMMELCEIPDFSLKDILSPTPARLRRQLSGIINFAKFREERLILLAELSTKREGLVDQLGQLREKNETLNNRLSLLREQTAEETGIITALENECRDIEAAIKALNQQQNFLKEETVQLREENTELKETIAAKYTQQEQLVALRKQLGLQIVSSPEKFRRQIVDVGQNLQNEQRDTKAAEKKAKELTAWLTNVDEAHEEVNGAIDAVTELRAEVDRQKAVIVDLEAQKQAVAAERTALSELSQRAQQAQRNAARSEEKLQQLRKQASVRGKDSQQSLEDLHRQLIEAEAFRMQVPTISLCEGVALHS